MNKYFILGFNKIAAPYTSASSSSSSSSSGASTSAPKATPTSYNDVAKNNGTKLKMKKPRELGGVFGPAYFK